MNNMKVRNVTWEENGKTVNIAHFLIYVLNTLPMNQHPRGLEAGRRYKDFIDAFDSEDEYVVLKKDVFNFGKKLIEQNIPMTFTQDKNISKLLDALDDAKEEKKE